ncbi:MAG: hypothetical protein PHC34_13310 [Candidatus Gastranaerophilales bacterium]|nr:hypothetical protein [Candidatus Gastranaerophilales bacterium]
MNIQTNYSFFNIQNYNNKFKKSNSQPAFGDKIVEFPTVKNKTENKPANDAKLNTIDGQLIWLDNALLQLKQPADIKIKLKATNEIFQQFDDLLGSYEIDTVIKDAYDTGKEEKMEEFFDKSFELIENLKKRQKPCETIEAIIDDLKEKYENGELPEDIDCNMACSIGNIADIEKSDLTKFFDLELFPLDKDTKFTVDIKLADFDKAKILDNFNFLLDKIESILKGQSEE